MYNGHFPTQTNRLKNDKIHLIFLIEGTKKWKITSISLVKETAIKIKVADNITITIATKVALSIDHF